MTSMQDLVYVGFNSRVAAINRDTGQTAWTWRSPTGSGYVTLLLDADRLIASVNGYTYCLHPETGQQLWFNPLEGLGVGVTSLVSVNGSSPGPHIAAAESDA